MRRIGRFIDAVTYYSGLVGGWVVLGTMMLMLIEVISRYILRSPLRIADEISGYAMVFVSFIGLAYTWRERGHIRVTFIVQKMRAGVSNYLRLFTLTAALGYSVVLIVASILFLRDAFRRGIVSTSELELPLAWPQLAIPIGATFMALILILIIAQAIRDMRAGKSIEELELERGRGG